MLFVDGIVLVLQLGPSCMVQKLRNWGWNGPGACYSMGHLDVAKRSWFRSAVGEMNLGQHGVNAISDLDPWVLHYSTQYIYIQLGLT